MPLPFVVLLSRPAVLGGLAVGLVKWRRNEWALPSLAATTAMLVAYALGHRKGARRQRARRALADLIAMKEVDESTLKQLLGDLPTWIKYPDYERSAWANNAIVILWPSMSQAISRTVKDALQQVLQNRKPEKIKSIGFETFALGTAAPRATGVKVYETAHEEVILDVEVSWKSRDANAILAVQLTSGTPPFPVQLSEVLFQGTVRIIFKPLMPYWPCFAGISVAFVGKPQVDFSLRLIGGELMSVPGLAHALNDLIKNRALALMIWPRCVVAPIRKGLAVRKLQTILAMPAGILRCHLIQGRGLTARHFTGVFVSLDLGGSIKDSVVMASGRDVAWDGGRVVDFIVQEPKLEGLRVTVQEVEDSANLDVQMLSPEEHIAQLRAKVAENDLSLYIRRIGENVVPVSSLPSCATVKDHKLPLGEANGCIHLDLQYIPFGVDEGGEPLEGLSEHMVGEHMISSPRPQPPAQGKGPKRPSVGDSVSSIHEAAAAGRKDQLAPASPAHHARAERGSGASSEAGSSAGADPPATPVAGNLRERSFSEDCMSPSARAHAEASTSGRLWPGRMKRSASHGEVRNPLQEEGEALESFLPREYAPQTGVLLVSLYGARGLVGNEIFTGLGEPFVRLGVGDCALDSRPLPHRSSRGWVENFQLTVADTSATPNLSIEVWDKGTSYSDFVSPLFFGAADDLIGSQSLPLQDVISLHIPHGKPQWYRVYLADEDGEEELKGELLVDFQWYGARARAFELTPPTILVSGVPGKGRRVDRKESESADVLRWRRRRVMRRVVSGLVTGTALAQLAVLLTFPSVQQFLASCLFGELAPAPPPRRSRLAAAFAWRRPATPGPMPLALHWAVALARGRERAGRAADRALRAYVAHDVSHLLLPSGANVLDYVLPYLPPQLKGWEGRLTEDHQVLINGAVLAAAFAVAARLLLWLWRNGVLSAMFQSPARWFDMDRAREEYVEQQKVMGRGARTAREAGAGGKASWPPPRQMTPRKERERLAAERANARRLSAEKPPGVARALVR